MQTISKAKIGRYSLLKNKKYRDREGLFIVQGRKAVEDTASSFEIEAIIVKKGYENEYFSSSPNYNVFEANDADIKKISTLETIPEVIGIYKIPDRKSHTCVNLPKEFYLVLDGVQDPGNLGTIIRTAHWFGIKRIFCSKDTVDQYNPKVVQSTMGSLGKIEIDYLDLKELFATNPHLAVYGLLLEGQNIFKSDSFTPGFILMGNEGNGISNELKASITYPLTIPPANKKDHPESLNVAIATAITLALTKK